MTNKLLLLVLLLDSFITYSQVDTGIPAPNLSSQFEVNIYQKNLLLIIINLADLTGSVTAKNENINLLANNSNAESRTWLDVNGVIRTIKFIYPDYKFENYFRKITSLKKKIHIQIIKSD